MAQLKLGAATFALQPLPDYTSLAKPPGRIGAIMGRPPRLVYLWSCRKQAGAPAKAPERVKMDADLIHVPRPAPPPGVRVMPGAMSPEKVLARATGLAMPKGVQAEIDKLFRPQIVALPLGRLIDPYKETQSRDLLIHERHAWFLATSDAVPEDEYLFRIPVAIRIEAVTRWVCSGEGQIGDRMGGEVRLRQTEASDALLRDHAETLVEVSERLIEPPRTDGADPRSGGD